MHYLKTAKECQIFLVIGYEGHPAHRAVTLPSLPTNLAPSKPQKIPVIDWLGIGRGWGEVEYA